jgi:hypothetical protein
MTTITRMSYAVVWNRPGAPEVSGRLDLRDDCVFLSGLRPWGSEAPLRVDRSELVDVHLERNGGGRVLVLVQADGSSLRLRSLEGAGALHELADALAA